MTTAAVTLNDIATLNAELAALVRARIPLEPELRRLGSQLPAGAAALAERLGKRMQDGDDLATALAAEGDTLPAAYRAVVAAGIQSGDLATALDDVAESAERLASLRRSAGMALILPAIVVVLASMLTAILLRTTFANFAWIAPETLAGYEQAARSPWLSLLLWLVVPMLAIGVPLVWWLASTGPRSSALRWIPGAGRLHRVSEAATLAEVLRIMVASGAPLPEALRTAADATSYRTYSNASRELAKRVTEGTQLASARDRQTEQITSQLPRLVRVSLRQSGDRELFASSLARASSSYHRQVDALSGVLADYVPAVLTVGVAGSITAAYTIGLMWPYTQMLYTMASGLWK